MKPARFRRRLQGLLLQISAQPMTAAFWALSFVTFVGATMVVWLGWPIWGETTSDFSGVVLAAGSATAFGSIVFSVVSSSFARASDIAPGYSVVVLGQRSPWLSGLGIISVAALLLLHATLDPTRSGAIAASLLAVSAVTWSWVAARQALGSADPLIIAQNASRYYRKATRRSARFATTALSKGWPSEIRSDPQLVQALTRKHQWDIVAGLLRQLRAGVRSTAGQGRLTESVMLLEGLVNAFIDYSSSLDGEVGEHDGLLEIVLSATDSVVRSSLQHADNEAGNYALRQLVFVGSQGFGDLDYAAARSLVLQKLNSYLNDSWNDDISTIPAASVVSIGELVRAWARIRAFEDVSSGLEALGQIGVRAIATRRKHIGYAATDQLAASFPRLANEPHSGLRRGYLKAWSEASAALMRLAPFEPIDGMAGVADALVPGVTVARSSSLQQVMWEVQSPNVAAAVRAILDALEPAVSSLQSEANENRIYERGFAEALSLAYGVTLLLSRIKDSDSGREQALRVVNMLLKATASDAGSKALSSADIAELVWSILLAAHYVGVNDDSLTNTTKSLLERIAVDEEWEPPPPDEEYMLAFIVGLKILAGISLNEINEWEEHVRSKQLSGDPFGSYWDWGMRIEGFGRAPSANRNRPAAPPAVIDAVNASALDQWPELAAEGDR